MSRKISIALEEKKIKFEEVIENIENPSKKFLSLHPLADIPTFIDGYIICPDIYSACEYIEETYPKPPLMETHPEFRASIRQIIYLFDQKFYHDVYLTIFYEKTLKRLIAKSAPDTNIIKKGKQSMHHYLSYLNIICDMNKFIACNMFSWADITVSSHLSCIDYLGEINWNQYQSLKEWYMKIKSRPSFQKILLEVFHGIEPSKHYSNLDF